MPSLVVQVPDIGEFHDVDVVEVLVAAGDRVEAEQALIVIESEKASMEVPSPQAGAVESVAVRVGSKVNAGDPICTLRVEAAETAAEAPAPRGARPRAEPPAREEEPSPGREAKPASQAARTAASAAGTRADVLVLGGGPGGYTAAFRAADLGRSVVLVERYPTLGGVCLNVGCIPSKALLHMAGVIESARALGEHGIEFGTPKLDFERIRARKDEVVATLTRGLARLAEQRGVEVVTGVGRFTGPHELVVTGARGEQRVGFEQAIL